MTKITLDLGKSVEQNAAVYFDKSKKQKKKLEGALEALEESRKKLARLEKQKEIELSKVVEAKIERKKKWFEKFRWFFTSNGMMVIGGRDATTNEIVIKKHTLPDDLVFHTDMAGSPFFILKTEGKAVSKEILKEVADATCSFSRAWKLGLGSQQVFYVKPEQVTKEANTGEYLTMGAFVIKGKTNYMENEINLAIGAMDDTSIMCAPLNAVKAHCKTFLIVLPGNEKSSSVAKLIKKKLEAGDLDEIIRALPAGGCKVKA
jgi:predicted ribosome quality control (RQC) complex YloA/Tae2 family protein